MLSLEKVNDVRQLLAQGLTGRCVARRAGVGRGAVLNIKHGRCTGRRVGKFSPDYINVRELRKQPKQVCLTCGLIGFMPCVACRARDSDTQVRRMIRSKKEKRNSGDLNVCLVNGELEAYEQLRAMKEYAGELCKEEAE